MNITNQKYSNKRNLAEYPIYSRSAIQNVKNNLVEYSVRKNIKHKVGLYQLHSVGDGVPWISGQVEKRFGSQGHYLVDFYLL